VTIDWDLRFATMEAELEALQVKKMQG